MRAVNVEDKVCFSPTKHNIQVDSVRVQIHTNNIWWGVIKVKVAGVHAHYKWTRRVEDACERQRAQGDVGTLPLEGENHLEGDKSQNQDYYSQTDVFKGFPMCKKKPKNNSSIFLSLLTSPFFHIAPPLKNIYKLNTEGK